MKIKETIVVEGRDDTIAIRSSVDALTIETHGYGIRNETWELIAKAYETTGIIVFTDPDHAGEQIRRRILERFPGAKEAFLDRALATRKDDVGIENASPESIRDALSKAHCTVMTAGGFGADGEGSAMTMDDMFDLGLTGGEGASARRQALGSALGVGFANAKTLLLRLNRFGITREQVEAALREI